jgi:hypothetical protein
MPLWHHAQEGTRHFFDPGLLPCLSAAYGFEVEAQQVFDAILALLSATSYTTRFAHDLEDDFPHVPFPADPDAFRMAAETGARLRALESFVDEPAQEFRRGRLIGRASGPDLEVPPPGRAFIGQGVDGHVVLREDQSLRIENVSQAAWEFSVSNYSVFYRWLRARNGETLTAALQREMLDVLARIEETLHCCTVADQVLDAAVEASLTRAQLRLTGAPGVIAGDDNGDAAI